MFLCLTVFCLEKLGRPENIVMCFYRSFLFYRPLTAEPKLLCFDGLSSSSNKLFPCFVVSELFDRSIFFFFLPVFPAFYSSFFFAVFMKSSSKFLLVIDFHLNFSNLVWLSFHCLSLPRLSALDSPSCSRFLTSFVRLWYSLRGSGCPLYNLIP